MTSDDASLSRFTSASSAAGVSTTVTRASASNIDCGSAGGVACCRLLFTGGRRYTRDEAAELQFAEHVQYLVAGEAAERRLVEIELRRCCGLDGDKVLALQQLLRVLPHQPLDAWRGHFVNALDERLGTAEFADELHRRLLADAGNAGDVVGRIAGECLFTSRCWAGSSPP